MTIESTPAGAKIFLNDEETGKTTPATLEKLEADKNVTIGLFLKDYQFHWEVVHTDPKKEKRIRVALTPNLGGIKIISQPPGAQVLMDGESAGQTPLQIDGLKPDQIIKVTIAMEGYQLKEQEVKIRAGTQQLISIKLERIP